MPDVAGSNLQVTKDLEQAGTILNTKATEIFDELNALKAKLAPLTDDTTSGGAWVGPASSYYRPLQAEWNMSAEGLFGPDGVLGQIASALNLAWNNYSDCEFSNTKTWQH